MAKKKPSMRRVAEGIYRRPSGKYVAPVYDPETGKKRYQWPGVPRGGFDTLDEARDFKRTMEAEKHRRGSTRETCDSFAARWMRDYPAKRSEQTRLHNAERVRAFAKDFKGVPLSEVTRPQAREWALAHPHHRKSVRAMFTDAARDGIVHENPFANQGLSEPKGRTDLLVLTEDEIKVLAQKAAAEWEEFGTEVFGPMIVTAAYTGMRPGELYALRWSAIDFEQDELQIKRQFVTKLGRETLPKGGKTRTITLLPQARVALQTVPRIDGFDQVFYNQRGYREGVEGVRGPGGSGGWAFNQRAVHYYWAAVRARFWETLSRDRQDEIDPGFDFYELRHFYGTHLATHWRLAPYEIADQMGHSDGGTLASKRYVHPLSRDVRANIRDRIREQALRATG